MLEARTAVVYGGGGAIGSAAARAFAREGARVFLRAAAGPHSMMWPAPSATRAV